MTSSNIHIQTDMETAK